MFSGREPVQFVGIVQKRVLLTPYWLATFCTSAAGSGPSSSSLFLTWWKAVCSLRFHWMSTRQVPRPHPTRPTPPKRVSPDRGQRVHVVPRIGIRAGGRQVSCGADLDDLPIEGQPRVRRLEERHRDLRQEAAVGTGQVDDQPVTPDLDAAHIRALAVVDRLGADDVRAVLVGDELRARRCEPLVRSAVDGVLEMLRPDRRSVAEAEPLADEERVPLAAVRDDDTSTPPRVAGSSRRALACPGSCRASPPSRTRATRRS